MQVPADVRVVLDQKPAPGLTADVIALLTVDAQGFPHVCLLSTAHLEADETHVRAVVRNGTTSANLDRTRQGCVVVVRDGAAHYCKVTVGASTEGAGLRAYSMEVAHHKVDRLPETVVHGMTYESTADLARLEQWEDAQLLMTQLRDAAAGHTQGT